MKTENVISFGNWLKKQITLQYNSKAIRIGHHLYNKDALFKAIDTMDNRLINHIVSQEKIYPFNDLENVMIDILISIAGFSSRQEAVHEYVKNKKK